MPISDKSYGLTADNEVVLRTDPRSVTTLAAEGANVPDNVWKEYGLPKPLGDEPEPTVATEPEEKPDKKAKDAPPENKAKSGLTINHA